MTGDDQLAGMLAIARDMLRGELQPALDAGLRYRAAMVASAMAIATRALTAGADSEARQLRTIAALYPDSAGADLRRAAVKQGHRTKRRTGGDIERDSPPASRVEPASLQACGDRRSHTPEDRQKRSGEEVERWGSRVVSSSFDRHA